MSGLELEGVANLRLRRIAASLAFPQSNRAALLYKIAERNVPIFPLRLPLAFPKPRDSGRAHIFFNVS